jgi:hypothetical protein
MRDRAALCLPQCQNSLFVNPFEIGAVGPDHFVPRAP